MRSCIIFVITLFITSGVFGVETDNVKTVSVMKGDSATLLTDVTLHPNDVIRTRWFNNKSLIAQISVGSSKICTDVQCDAGNERFRDRLKLNHQTGSLTITNTRTTDSGLYELKISSISSVTEKTFSVTVSISDKQSADQDPGVSSGESSALSPGAVIGVIVGLLLVVGVGVGVILYLRRTSVRNGLHVIYQRTRSQEDQENE